MRTDEIIGWAAIPIVVTILIWTGFQLDLFKWKGKQKRSKCLWNDLPDDLKFIALHPPGGEFTVDQQLQIDRILCGVCYYTVNEKGEKQRIDPTKIIIEYLK